MKKQIDFERAKANPLLLSIWAFVSLAIHVLLFRPKVSTVQSLSVRMAIALVAIISTITIHELIHFIFASVRCKSKPTIRISKDKFGFPTLVTFFDSDASKWRRVVITMMPFLLLTVALDAFMFAAEEIPLFLLIMAASNCGGSFYDILDILGALIKKPAERLDFGEKLMINEIPKNRRIDVLRQYESYDEAKEEKDYFYITVLRKRIPLIIEKYGYKTYMKGYSDKTDEFAFRLLHFVSSNFHHKGDMKLPACRKVTDIVYAAGRNSGNTNCRGLSIILSELLRANGIKARLVTCKPFEEPFEDCHVVVDCILPSQKRVMLDPTYNLYLKDENGKLVSLEELRRGIIKGTKFVANDDASYNGGEFNLEDYIEYMAKNTVRFTANVRLADVAVEKEEDEIELVPANYPTEGFPENKKFVYNDRRFWNI